MEKKSKKYRSGRMQNANANLLIYLDKFARRGSHAARARGEYICLYIIHSRVAVLSQHTSITFHDLEIQFDPQTVPCQRISPFRFLFFQKVPCLYHKRLPYFTALKR